MITGPTASGKTDLAIRVALKLDGEIVSADSRQVYRHMDIGTSKPGLAQRKQVPHHLLDLVNPDEVYSAGRFQRDAIAAISNVRNRGHRPIVVGGCGLYIRSLLNGLSPVPPVPPEVRARVRGEARRSGPAALFSRLKSVDSESARRIRPADRQRIVRALAVYEASGRPLSYWQARPREGGHTGRAQVIGLRVEREELYRRIDARARRMLAQGLVDEVEVLIRMGYAPEGSALGTFGYREIVGHLRGEIGLEEAIRGIQQQTRRYAKRQLTWFRGEPRIQWVDALGSEPEQEILKVLE